jgi:chromate transporter
VLPIFLTLWVFGADSTFHQLNVFFSKTSMVTFGGAYAALSYVAQKAVEVYGWLQGAEMLDGLAMAETTPGPLIQTVQFVGFMASYRFPDGLHPLWAATLGSVLVTWMTFAPCFLWIFTFAPYVEYLRSCKSLSYALKGISAAVVGVILNLSIWFILKALFASSQAIKVFPLDFEYPLVPTLDPYALGICVASILMIFAFKRSLHFTLLVSVVLGILTKFLLAAQA